MKKSIKFFLYFLGLFLVFYLLFSQGSGFLLRESDKNAAVQNLNFQSDTKPSKYYLAKVAGLSKTESAVGQYATITQIISVQFLTGPRKNDAIDIRQDSTVSVENATQAQQTRVSRGDIVVVTAVSREDGESQYFVSDYYRLPFLAIAVAFFFALAIFFGGKRGLGSLLGLIVSMAVLGGFLIPKIMAGENPLLISLISSLFIAVVSLYLAHGFNRRTSIALLGMVITIGLAAVMATYGVSLTRLFGTGSEEIVYLQQLPNLTNLDFRGLLLAGIMIGVLGVLDDTTTIQAATVEELKRADAKLSFGELYRRGISVGREHITSLVNTLILAYAGSQLILFLLFYSDPYQPLWVTLNSEFIAEEIVRTLVGSAALILAVPITTLLAAFFFSRKKFRTESLLDGS